MVPNKAWTLVCQHGRKNVHNTTHVLDGQASFKEVGILFKFLDQGCVD
jgi:hypothetical protein